MNVRRRHPLERGKLKVVGDPTLRPEEKETSLHLLGNSKRIEVHSFHPTVIRGLLAQPEFEVSQLFKKNIKGEEVIVGIKGKFPISSLKIGRARRDQHLSRVFSRRVSSQNAGVVCRTDTNRHPQGEDSTSLLPEEYPSDLRGILDA